MPKLTVDGELDGKPFKLEGEPEAIVIALRTLYGLNGRSTPLQPKPQRIGAHEEKGTLFIGPDPPPVEKVVEFIQAQPRAEHKVSDVIDALAEEHIPSREPGKGADGRQNRQYGRWVDTIKEAREHIEETTGISFKDERDGRSRRYWLPESP